MRCSAGLVLAMGLVAATSAARAEHELRTSVSVAPRAILDYITDGHGLSDKHALATGLAADMMWRSRQRWRVGLGLRTTTWWSEGAWLAQELDAMAVGGLHLARASGASLDLELLAGLMAALFPHEDAHTGPLLLAAGPCAELSVTYTHPIPNHDDLALTFGVAARFALPDVQNGTGYLSNAPGVHLELPLRVGLRWR